MSYLVDGNNVMAQRAGWHRDKQRARLALLDEVARFARVKRVRVAVVFDGAPLQHFADGSSYKGVRLFYAERGSNADERIKRFTEEARERRTLIVITSDRALADYVRRCGAQVLSSGEFRKRLDASRDSETEGAQEDTEKMLAPSDEGKMKEWMRYFGVAPEDDE